MKSSVKKPTKLTAEEELNAQITSDEINEFLKSLGNDPEPSLPELSQEDAHILSEFLDLVDDDEIELYKERVKRFGVSEIIKEIKYSRQCRHEYQMILDMASMLLTQFEFKNRPHVVKLDVLMSRSDIMDSDIWYQLWEALVQFQRWHNRAALLTNELPKDLKKTDFGYRFVKQML